jgi:hypothetical protein
MRNIFCNIINGLGTGKSARQVLWHPIAEAIFDGIQPTRTKSYEKWQGTLTSCRERNRMLFDSAT